MTPIPLIKPVLGLIAAALIATCAPPASPARAQTQGQTPAPTSAAFVYGDNPAAGAYFEHDGLRLYYEVYGQGPPLLLIHGNGQSIWWMKHQIDFFRSHYRVIVMDSRDHGHSGDVARPLTFEDMADDLSALLDHLHAGPTLVLGWSDGAIEALLLGMRHPLQVSRIAAMSANLDTKGYGPEISELMNFAPMRANDPIFTRAERVEDLDRFEPHIRPVDLKAISAPTLIMAGDHDLIAGAHTLTIFHHIKGAELAIFPGATHMLPVEDPQRFNATVERFFEARSQPEDPLRDLLAALKRLRAEHKAELRSAPTR